MTRSKAGRKGGEAAMLGPFSHTPPPDEKGKKVAWAVAWATLVMGAVMMVLSVVLPP
jgi:putative exporter of polyketide antibiotics